MTDNPNALSEARLAGELAMREAASKHIPWSTGQCSCGVSYAESSSKNPCQDWADHVLSLPLTPESADVLERKLKAEYARGYENGRDTACPVDGEGHPYGPQSGD